MEKGDIIWLDYDGWLIGARPEEDELFETTNESLAKEKKLYDEKIVYKPKPIIVGIERLIKGLDKSILSSEIGKEYTIEILPNDAYGERDTKLVELHSKHEIMRLPEFRMKEFEPYIGMEIILKNRVGRIVGITAGRVRIDFNNRFAGRKLRYKYVIKSRAESLKDKVEAIITMHYGKTEGFFIEVSENEAKIFLPDTCKFDPVWFAMKAKIVDDLKEYCGLTKLNFIEEYKKL
ncbi:MAG: FKBP-type peptidyl-prolyl cis-trans isomerase [Candidatus Thermoplasmatota archaeon]